MINNNEDIVSLDPVRKLGTYKNIGDNFPIEMQYNTDFVSFPNNNKKIKMQFGDNLG